MVSSEVLTSLRLSVLVPKLLALDVLLYTDLVQEVLMGFAVYFKVGG